MLINYFRKHQIQFSFALLLVFSLTRIMLSLSNSNFIKNKSEMSFSYFIPYLIFLIIELLFLISIYKVKKKFSSIGLHAKNIWITFAIGLGVPLIFYILLHQSPDINESVKFGKKYLRPAFIIFSILTNSILMQEILFRGLFLPLFFEKYKSFWKANLFQSLIFGLWQAGLSIFLMPVRTYPSIILTFISILSIILFIFLFSFINGLQYGYICYKTRNLWVLILAKLVVDIAGHSFYVKTNSDIDMTTIFNAFLSFIIFLLMVFFATWTGNKYNSHPLNKNQNLK